MAERERRDWTVLVLGRPGQPTRRYHVGRRAFGLSAVTLVLGALGIGFVIGKGGHPRTAVASTRSAAPALRGGAAFASSHPVQAEPAIPPALTTRPAPPAAPPVAAVTTVAAARPGALRLLRSASSEQVMEIHPFTADGSPSASAFQLLETVMACGDGHHQAPDPALVRVLLEAQHEFDKPLVLLGGRCARHDDHPEAVDQHRAGRAADVRVRDVSSEALMSWLVKRGVGGAGHYKHRGGFVHVDVRGGSLEQWEGKEPGPSKPIAKPEPEAPVSAEAPAQAPAPAAADN